MTGPVAGAAAAGDVRRAWWSLAAYPVTFVLAFVVGEGIASLFVDPSDDAGDVPVWVMLAAGVPALLVFAAPAVLATVFARRAARAGDRRGRVPMRLAQAIAAAFVLLNVVSGVLVVLLD